MSSEFMYVFFPRIFKDPPDKDSLFPVKISIEPAFLAEPDDSNIEPPRDVPYPTLIPISPEFDEEPVEIRSEPDRPEEAVPDKIDIFPLLVLLEEVSIDTVPLPPNLLIPLEIDTVPASSDSALPPRINVPPPSELLFNASPAFKNSVPPVLELSLEMPASIFTDPLVNKSELLPLSIKIFPPPVRPSPLRIFTLPP